MGYSSSEVRRFLLEAFSDEEIGAFSFDYFTEAQHEFASGMSQGEKVQRLLDYCQMRNLVRLLFIALQKERPEQFKTLIGTSLPENLEQLFLAGEEGGLSLASLRTYADFTEKAEARHVKAIHTRQRYAIAIIVVGLLVAGSAALPIGVKPSVGVFGAFVCFLSVVPGIEILYRKYKVELCDNAQEMLDILKLAYQAGDVSGSTQMEQNIQLLLRKIATV